MVALEPGVVVLVRFPFSDLSASKFRPAVVLAHAGGPDWVLCQVTSNPFGDPKAVPLKDAAFASGGLQRESFARPGKLFTASGSIVERTVGRLNSVALTTLIQAVVGVLHGDDTYLTR